VIDLIGEVGEPITAVHLGAGALTLPRYVEATRPGSRQQVVELESDLIDFVRGELPWDKRAQLRVRHGDAREVLAKLPAGLHGAVDLVVVDIFSGARTPAHVTSREFYELAAPLLSPRGVLVVNVADGPGLPFARSQAATLSAVFGHVLALAETQVLKGRRFGNIVFVAAHTPIDTSWVSRLLAGGPLSRRRLSWSGAGPGRAGPSLPYVGRHARRRGQLRRSGAEVQRASVFTRPDALTHSNLLS